MKRTSVLLIGIGASMIVALVVLMAGCHMKNGGQELFEDGLNLQVGHPIKDLEKFLHERNELEDGKSEYVFREEGGCSFAYIVDGDGIIESWRYVSDPALCKRKFGWGPF